MSCLARNAGDDLYLKVEPREPVDPDRHPAWIGRIREDLVLHGQNGVELLFGIGMKGRHVDHVVERAAGRL